MPSIDSRVESLEQQINTSKDFSTYSLTELKAMVLDHTERVIGRSLSENEFDQFAELVTKERGTIAETTEMEVGQ